MKRKCLTTAAKKGVFIQSTTQNDVFRTTPETSSNLPFYWFRIAKPIQQYLISQGAKYVVESSEGIKILHTGLKPTNVNHIYSGNMVNVSTKVKSLLLFCADPINKQYTVYMFEGYNPKSLTKVLNEILSHER